VEERIYIVLSKNLLIKTYSELTGMREREAEEWIRKEWSCEEVETNKNLLKCLVAKTVTNGNVKETIINLPLLTFAAILGYRSP